MRQGACAGHNWSPQRKQSVGEEVCTDVGRPGGVGDVHRAQRSQDVAGLGEEWEKRRVTNSGRRNGRRLPESCESPQYKGGRGATI
jgi:hypothetical protein